MVAVRVGPPTCLIVVASPDYLKRHGQLRTPADLDGHNCISYRLHTGGGLFPWTLTRGDKESRSRVAGQLILDDGDLAVTMALAGAGLALMLEEKAAPHLAVGRLVRVLDEWCVPFGGLHLYYPSRHVSPALRALLDALLARRPDMPSST